MFFDLESSIVRSKHISASLLLLISTFAGHSAQSEEALELEADSVSYNNKTGVAIYHGNVKISRGDITLEGDVVEVHTVDNKVIKLIATAGPSRLVRRENHHTIEAEAQRIEYRMAQGIVDLLGQVKIKDEDKLLTGDHAIYNIEQRTVNMEKKKNRVKLIIQSETKTPKQ